MKKFRKRITVFNRIKKLKLFKYLDDQYMESFTENAEVLFRSLSYFQQGPESDLRTDQLDGKKQYSPEKPFIIKNLTQGNEFSSSEMIDPVDSERVFVFCTSKSLKPELYERFQCSHCVEIRDVVRFIAEIDKQLKKQDKLSKIYHDDIAYYSPEKNESFEFLDPYRIPFLKREDSFEIEDEYRMFFVEGEKLQKKKTVRFSDSDDKSNPTILEEKEIFINIGSLLDYSVIHSL